MARTFNDTEARQFAAVITEVNRLKAVIEEADGQQGTLRPKGHSLGKLYERLGIHLVAMHNEGISPARAISMIRQVAEDAEDIDTAALISMIQTEALDLGDPNVYILAAGPDEPC